jgi:hypothetical protein
MPPEDPPETPTTDEPAADDEHQLDAEPKDPNLPDPSRGAVVAMAIFVMLAVGSALLLDLTGIDQDPPFDPNKAKSADLTLFAGFFLAAAAIERVLELIAPALPLWNFDGSKEAKEITTRARAATIAAVSKSPARPGVSASTNDAASDEAKDEVVQQAIQQKKADRGYSILGLATWLGVLGSGIAGLYLLSAVGMEAPRWIDMLITGVALSGGTKGLHELIKTLQKAKGPTVAG